MDPERYENAFLGVSACVLVVFLAALGLAATSMHMHLPSRAGDIDPAAAMKTPPFDRPGVREVAPGKYEAVILARAWSFFPNRIRVPAGSEVKLIATSLDVLHGFAIEGTRVNVMLIPGQISELTYVFRKPGEHLLICHEYCGAAHQNMFGKVIVE